MKSNKKKITENILSLTILQGINYILPLFTLPYLLRMLGPEKYGLIIFSQSFIQYFILLTDYGFNLSATKEISIHRKDVRKVSQIFSAVFFIKIILMIFCLIITTMITNSFDKFSDDKLVIYCTFGMVLGNVLFPVWYFQGIEKMKYITLINIIPKIVCTGLIFLLVKGQSDYLFVPILNSLGPILSGVISLIIILRYFNLNFSVPTFNSVLFQLKEGWHVFISTLSISLYTITNTFILGVFTNNLIVGYYASAQKIVQAVQNLFVPISQAIFPHINNLARESKSRAIKFIKFSSILLCFASILFSFLLFVYARSLINLLFGQSYLESIVVLRILSILPFIVVLTNLLGTQTLLVFGFKKIFSLSIVIPSIIHILFLILFVPKFGLIGISILTVCTEIFIVLIRIIGLHKNRAFFREV